MRVERMGLALVLAVALAGCAAKEQAQAAAPVEKGGSDENSRRH